MSRFGNAVLLKGAVDSVAREKWLGAERLISLLAEAAGKAGPVEPFNTRIVADFDVIDEVAFCDYDAGAFVASDERQLSSLAGALAICRVIVV